MYHKISNFLLNTAKNKDSHQELYIGQPDAITEKLAGKVFIIADLEMKKNEARDLMGQTINYLNEFYYQDEKIFLRDKIEGLELDNIFEASLTKLNKALNEYVNQKRFKIKLNNFNLTVGLIFEDKLFFSNIGRNKAYLIFKKENQYELINVEASATDLKVENTNNKDYINHHFFSSVISGEIPTGSYFFFCNEALPEYISSKELALIISKLPPVVAAEQLKTSLSKINNFVPFIALIIKNTFGLNESEFNQTKAEPNTIKLSESKTEEVLAPTALFSFDKLKTSLNLFISKFKHEKKNKEEDKKVKQALKQNNLDIKEKIILAKSKSNFKRATNASKSFILNILRPTKIFHGVKKLEIRHKLVFLGVITLIIILTFSLISQANRNKREAQIAYFNEQVEILTERFELIDPYLLYDNEEGAKIVIGEISESLNSLSAVNESQEEEISKLEDKIREKVALIQKLTIVENPNELINLASVNPSAEPRNIIFFQDQLYLADVIGKTIYRYQTENQESSSILISSDNLEELKKPIIFNDNLYYLNNNSLLRVNPENEQINEVEITGLADLETKAFDLYPLNNLLYTLHPNNSILRHFPANDYSQANEWLQDNLDLNLAIDMKVTGEIWVLLENAKLYRLYLNTQADFELADIDPPLQQATKLLLDDNYLYVFDSFSGRLAIFNRSDGSFVSQFEFKTDDKWLDISIDYENKKAYLLANTRIFSFPIEF
jgi:hypothetical protein